MGVLDPTPPLPGDPLTVANESRDRDIPRMVHDALAAGRTHLVYQPVVVGGAPSRIAFHEGFIRVTDARGLILPAAQFMPSVEETAMGRELDRASLRLGLRKLRVLPELKLAVNMSARSIADGGWRRLLLRGLGSDPSIGNRLILEISEESAMLLPEIVIGFMAEMQPKGVTFALDDFGAGPIAFRHLKDFVFDMVKIDRHFITGIGQSPDNQVIAEALVTVAHQFEMFVVAEGVETAEEAGHMIRLGADCLQGWHFGVPKPQL